MASLCCHNLPVHVVHEFINLLAKLRPELLFVVLRVENSRLEVIISHLV